MPNPAPPPLPDDAALLRILSRPAVEAGRAYAARGAVRRAAISADGHMIQAAVQGTAARPYVQHISLHRRRDGSTAFEGVCTCPAGIDCKHVAAALFAVRGERGAPPSPTPPRPTEAPAMPPEVADWLRQLGAISEDDPEAYPADIRQRVVYVVAPLDRPVGPPSLRIAAFMVTLRKDGSYGTGKGVQAQAGTARYLRPSDRKILRRTDLLRHAPEGILRDEDPADLLRRIIATGRGRWGALEGPALREGPAWPGSLAWRLEQDGRQRPALELAEGLLGLALPAPWYADPGSGELGTVDLGVPAHVAARLLLAPPIPAEAAPLVAAELGRRLAAPALALPAVLDAPEALSGPPVPRLLLTAGRLAAYMMRGYGHGLPGQGFAQPEVSLPLARLGFRYGPLLVAHDMRAAHGPPRPGAELVARDGRLYRLRRDAAAERAAVTRLLGIGFVATGMLLGSSGCADAFLLDDQTEDDPDWLFVLREEIPALRMAGWEVEVAAEFPIRLVEPEGPVQARLEEGSGIDWLDLHLGVTVDGQQVDLVPVLLALMAAGVDQEDFAEGPVLLPLPDGRLLAVPREQILPILQSLMELFEGGGLDPETGRIGFTRMDAAELAGIEAGSGITWQGGEALRALGAQLRAAEGSIPPVALPADFTGTLRPYQAQGVAWLQFLRGAGLGGVLADDMGLGKTVQTLAHLAIEQAAGRLDRPALIVCPTSLVPNWLREAARFAPGLRVLPLHGPARKARFGGIAAHDLVLTTYPLLTRDQEALTAQDWHVVVLDEAQTIKNPNAETTRQALQLRARQRLCLSGTPLQNHLGELWSLFDFLAPGFLGSARSFRARYRTPIEKHGDTERQAALHRRVRPFLLRRTKEAVATELPPKTEIAEPIEMAPPQRAVYEAIRLAMHARVKQAVAEKGLARSGIIILDALLKLRQACCDPRLLALASAQKAGSAKLERLLDLLGILLDEGRRVLIFSQFTSMLALIEAALRKAGTPYVLLTGETRDREAPVRRFQAGEVPVFLISLKAGGVGLNLTAADTVVHYDPWWNPAVEDQATDRAHRIGQSRQVFVHRLITLGTIEEKMEMLKDRKRALVASVLDAEHGGALKLTEADVEELFAAA
ncbi:SNF2-related protein [Dankookia sp. GCM10030260]|uniref:DEAD/DEAH box helicase n=1 Tax=Dankookia sp. GCM10030260 TaxID=3273390 RepID=UPI0036177DB8